MTKNIVSNNCQIPIPDCFNKNGLPQLGVNPFNEPPTLSELAFVNRYGGSKNTTIHKIHKTQYTTTNRKTKNRKMTTKNRKMTTNNRNTKNTKNIKMTTKNRNTKNIKTNRKKTTNNRKKTTNNRKMIGGEGYYLKLDDLINNMPVVKSYNSCCPPLFDGKLLTNKI